MDRVLGESGMTLEEILEELDGQVFAVGDRLSLIDIMAEFDLTMDEAELVAERWLEHRREVSR